MRGMSCSDDQWINSYQKKSFSYISRNLMVSYADVMRIISNIFLTRSQPFWDNKCFKYYEEKCEYFNFTEKLMTLSK